MTDVSGVNRHVPNFFDSIPDLNANADGNKKVMLDASGAITESRESRGHLFFKAHNKMLTEKTQVSVNVLRNALTNEIGAKGLEIFNRFVSAKNLSGKKRLTMQNLINIKNAVTSYRNSLANGGSAIIKSNKRLDLSQIKSLNHKNTYLTDNAGIERKLSNFGTLSNCHKNVTDEIRATVDLLNGIPKDFSGSTLKDVRAFDSLEKILTDTREKLNLCKEKLDVLNSKVSDRKGKFSDATVNDSTNLKSITDSLKAKINSIIDGLDRRITDCHVAQNNNGNIYKNVRDGFSVKIQAIIETAKEAEKKIIADRDASHDQKHIAKCNTALNKLNNIKSTYRAHQARLDSYHLQDGDTVPKSFLKLFKKMGKDMGAEIKELVNPLHIANYSLDKQCVMTRFASIMGAKDCWKQEIVRDISMATPDGEKVFQSRLIPAKKMNPALYGQGVNGNPSTALRSPDLTNCFKSEICDANGRKLFSGYRHGILDSIKLSSSDNARQANANNKAKQLLTTILLDRFSDSLRPGATSQRKPLEINLTSVNLVNPIAVPKFFDEGTMSRKQKAALESLTKNTNGQSGPIKLNINGEDVWVKVNLRTFITPCNKHSHGIAGKLIWSKAQDLGRNSETFSQLFGPEFMRHNSSPDRLKSGVPFAEQFREFKESINPNSDVGKFLNRNNITEAEKKKVFVLAHEINILMQSDHYRDSKIDAFELPARIALLNDMVGNVCCYNCKSGKDRTGHMDIVTKQLAVKMTALENPNLTTSEFLTNSSCIIRHLDGRTYSTANDMQNFDQLIKNSGNLEIHQMNTGLMGSKVHKLTGITDHLGTQELFKFYAGASKYVKS